MTVSKKITVKLILRTSAPLPDTLKKNHVPIQTKMPHTERPQPAKLKPTATSPPKPYPCNQMELHTTPVPYRPTQYFPAPTPRAAVRGVPAELGKHITSDMELLEHVWWKEFVQMKHGESDVSLLDNVHHPARGLIRDLKYHGTPMRFSTKEWSHDQISATLSHVTHKSYMEYLDFLHEEFTNMV